MCLSTVYKNTKEDGNIAMRNVMRLECRDGQVLITDLMDRTLAITGELVEANLVDGFVIIKETA